jgi:hypothetical protein
MTDDQMDYVDKAGAEVLGNRIAGYWRSCGHDEVGVRLEFLRGSGI